MSWLGRWSGQTFGQWFGAVDGGSEPPTPPSSTTRRYGFWRTIFHSTEAQRRLKWRTAQRR